jgi:signal transduction histidine kinase
MAGKNYNEALKLYTESLTIRERNDDSKGISSTLSRIGTVYTETGRFKEAAKVLTRSLNIAQTISTIDEQLSSLLALAKLKAVTNQPDSAIWLMKLYIVTKDSVYDARIKQQILDVQSQYETDKLEQDLELVKREKEFTEIKLQNRKIQLLLLISVFVSLTGAGIFLFYRHQQNQKSAAAAERINEQEIRMGAVFQAQEEERRRIAKELHDGVGQTISAIRMNYQSFALKASEKEFAPDFKKIEAMLDSACKEVRSISHQMIPRELEQFGLIAAIEGMLNLNLEHATIQYQFEHSGFTDRINPQIELVLFRVLQELVSNVIKHSKADNLNVQLVKLKSHVAVTVSDDGIGFYVEQKEKNGIGLLNIASRIDGIKGHLHYESAPGAGTTVTIRIPTV